jgi:hypothetical protein
MSERLGSTPLEYVADARELLPVDSSDPLVWQMLDELQLKAELFAGEIHFGESDPSIVEPIKRFGMFVITDQTALADWPFTDDEFSLSQGDRFLNVHMPPPIEGQPRPTLAQAAEDYAHIADYIRQHDLPIKYILGITYQRLAVTGRRQNYTMFAVELPSVLAETQRAIYDKHLAASAKDPGPTTLLYHTRESFLTQFPAN